MRFMPQQQLLRANPEPGVYERRQRTCRDCGKQNCTFILLRSASCLLTKDCTKWGLHRSSRSGWTHCNSRIIGSLASQSCERRHDPKYSHSATFGTVDRVHSLQNLAVPNALCVPASPCDSRSGRRVVVCTSFSGKLCHLRSVIRDLYRFF
jgi:hypothetical protein